MSAGWLSPYAANAAILGRASQLRRTVPLPNGSDKAFAAGKPEQHAKKQSSVWQEHTEDFLFCEHPVISRFLAHQRRCSASMGVMRLALAAG